MYSVSFLSNQRVPVKNWLRNAGSKRKVAYYAKKRALEKQGTGSANDGSSNATPRSAREPGEAEPRVIRDEDVERGETDV